MIRISPFALGLGLCLALTGCETVEQMIPDFGGQGGGAAAQDSAQDQASGAGSGGNATAQDDAGSGEQQAAAAAPGSLSIAEPAPPEDSPQPAARLRGTGWKARVSPDIPYFNLGGGAVPTYSDSDLSERTGSLGRGEGGFVETCREDAAVCRVATGSGESVWVEITRLSGVAN
ncbi:hypothetical protein [Cognatishimia sp. F0-27]|uniref:hypothetical protein n=1 Tax=Cognatishimia sp. F0-27 TaxID=2816855 RepID=UPI001D0CBF34|nr:hypothetical protein [Cognatishimia sp. F0-27]MCC1492277.1 hypothetical protein [Cognatishimia sp. F0-27]